MTRTTQVHIHTYKSVTYIIEAIGAALSASAMSASGCDADRAIPLARVPAFIRRAARAQFAIAI